MRRRGNKHFWLLLPGSAVALFAVSAIALPVGSDGLGATLTPQPGLAPALACWARDIHDGFWRASQDPRALSDRRLAQELCRRGKAEEAVAIYRRIGAVTAEDQASLWQLFDWILCNGQYDRLEWYSRAADSLLHSGMLRNNLAWHYTQTEQRAVQALALASESVAFERNACNVDTLAWAYWRNGDFAKAVKTAHQTLAFGSAWMAGLASFEQEEAKASSRKLLDLMAQPELAQQVDRSSLPLTVPNLALDLGQTAQPAR